MRTDKDAVAAIAAVVGRLPEWLRTDLASKDGGLRERAEESLAAMISAAIDPLPDAQAA